MKVIQVAKAGGALELVDRDIPEVKPELGCASKCKHAGSAIATCC